MGKVKEKTKHFYMDDGEICCKKCGESVRFMKIQITGVVVGFEITADGEVVGRDWDYGKVALVCDCGVSFPEDVYEWKYDDYWTLTINEDAIEGSQDQL